MTMHKILVFLLFFVLVLKVSAQRSLNENDPDYLYKKGLELFQKEKYGAAQKFFEEAMEKYGEHYYDLKTNAGFYHALCAIELFNKDAEYLISRFIAEYPESPKARQAYFEMGKFRYKQENFANAIYWFEKVNMDNLIREDLSEYSFKLGYAYFMEGNTEMANYHFYRIKDRDTRYTAPAIYYYAHIAYEKENYQTALQEFKRLSEDQTFSVVVPYYITQIYFYQEKYDQVITYGKELLETASVKRKPEISKLIGESYYRKNQYAEALPYLKTFNEKGSKTGRKDKYQLGFTYYKLDSLNKAIEFFEIVTGEDDELSQNAYYHLADCYLKTGEKNKARLAFSAASKMDYDESLQEDALFNYAKISLELKYTPFNDAIIAFNQYLDKYKDSYKREEVYNYLVTAYMNTRNYKAAMESMDKIQNKSTSIQQAYQRVAFFRGLELFNNLEFQEAIDAFQKSLQFDGFDRKIKAKSQYWMAEAYYRLNRFQEAINVYDEFLLSSGSFMVEEFNVAHYNLGYCYFKLSDYSEALSWFRKYVNFEAVKNNPKLGDAYNRIGDCYFMQKNYWLAIENYESAIEHNTPDADYAYYQKGFALGLVERPNKKITTLKTLIDAFPSTAYFDDALFELGRSYIVIEKQNMALEHFKLITEQFPLSSYVREALLQIGLIHYNQNKNDSALTYYKRLVTEYPSTPEARSALTGMKNIYVDMNRVEEYFEFVNSLDEGITISVSEQDSLIYIAAEKKYMTGNCEESLPNFDNYIGKFPNGKFIINAYFYKGLCHINQGDTALAIQSLNFVTSKPQNEFSEDALLELARLHYQNNQMLKAYDTYLRLEKVAESANYLHESRIGLMRSAFALGNSRDVIFACDKVLMNKKIAEEVKREAHFKKGKAYYDLKRYDEALDELRLIADNISSEEGAEAKYLVAKIYYDQQDYKLAEQEIRDFISMSSPHAYWLGNCFILLSDVYKEQDEIFKAKATLQSLIDHYTITDDGIIDEANSKLLEIIKEEKNREFKDEQEDIELNFESPEDAGVQDKNIDNQNIPLPDTSDANN